MILMDIKSFVRCFFLDLLRSWFFVLSLFIFNTVNYINWFSKVSKLNTPRYLINALLDSICLIFEMLCFSTELTSNVLLDISAWLPYSQGLKMNFLFPESYVELMLNFHDDNYRKQLILGFS